MEFSLILLEVYTKKIAIIQTEVTRPNHCTDFDEIRHRDS